MYTLSAYKLSTLFAVILDQMSKFHKLQKDRIYVTYLILPTKYILST